MKISENKFSRILKPLLFILLLLPAFYYGWGVWQDALGANPLEAVIRGLGDWGLRILLLTLAISPLRRLLNWAQLLRLRRMIGFMLTSMWCCIFSVIFGLINSLIGKKSGLILLNVHLLRWV